MTPSRANLRSESGTQLPTYVRLRELLRAEVEGGGFDDGKPLPTEAELIERFGVSRHTVRQALSELTAEGLVTRTRGRGTYATGAHNRKFIRTVGSVGDLIKMSHETIIDVVQPLKEIRDSAAAERLLQPDERVSALSLIRLLQDEPLGISDVYLPLWVGKKLPPMSGRIERPLTIIELVEEAIHQDIVEAEQEVTAVAATPQLARWLKVARRSPLLRIERVYHLASREPVEFAVSHYRPDRYSYSIGLRRRPGW